MATEKTFNTRIQLKYDTWDNWNTTAAKALVLKQGELAIVYVPANTVSGQTTSEPAFLIKIGDGTTKFESLPWVQAEAADVYEWAKASTKPTYTANEISNLDSYISENIATNLPVASPTQLGGVKPVAKTDAMTRSIGVDDNGGLYTEPAEVFYIDLEGSYPNYTCPVAHADIKAAYEAGKVLKCRCNKNFITETLPLVTVIPLAGIWAFSTGGALSELGLKPTMFSVAITEDGVLVEETEVVRQDDSLKFPNPYVLTFGAKTYDGSANRTITADDLGAVTDISGKQDKLTFDGTYNASTNKAATVSTVTNAINGLSAIAKSGSVSDLTQPNDVVIVFNCGSSSTVI